MDVNFYSKGKHWCLRGYLSIVRNVLKGKGRSFTFIDLFSGDGICTVQEPIKDSWDGPPITALKCAKKAAFDFKCIFNDLDSDKIRILNDRISPYRDFVIGVYNEEADSVYRKILTQLNRDELNLFYIDPNKHSDISWATIKDICEFESTAYYEGKRFIRRPELLINLMTHSMQRGGIPYDPESIDKCLGTSSWREQIVAKSSRTPMHKIFLNTFLDQLQPYYDRNKNVFVMEVRQLENKSLLYYLIFATTHPLASKIFSSYQKYVKQYQKNDLMSEYLGMDAKAKGLSSLFDF